MNKEKRDSSTYIVKSTSISGQYRKINLLDIRGKVIQIKLHRFAQVGNEDKIFVDPNHIDKVSVLSSENPADLIPVCPHYEKTESLTIGNSSIKLLIKEITSVGELADYQFLEGFHYKTSTAILSEDSGNNHKDLKFSGGRKAVLLCYMKIGPNWKPFGYIELQMPLLMVKARHLLFAAPFNHPSRPIKWDAWNIEAVKKYVNLIVRIARVVISPEIRGLGLSRIIILSAIQYAKERWHINGKRPLFIEISAEMLKYLDFVSTSGLRYVGMTEGNLDRIHKDLIYMQKGYKISSGIMTLQSKYLNDLKHAVDANGQDFTDVLNKLKDLTEGVDESTLRIRLNKLDPAEWYLFRRVLRFPIPYYIGGLDDISQKYIDSNINSHKPKRDNNIKTTPVRLNIKDIRVTSLFTLPDSMNVRAIKNCFGIDSDIINSKLLGPISIEASPGNIILITGSSGSGKTLLLKAVDPNYEDANLLVHKRNILGNHYSAAWLKEINSDKPLIEYFSIKWGIEAAISALNQVGLSEAFIYLKPYYLLSRGQQYRARLAELSFGHESIWLIDEFCTDLDPFTAKIVASKLRKHVIKYQKIAFVASANAAHYIDSLKPTRIIVLRQNATPEIFNLGEYVNDFCRESESEICHSL